MIFRSLCRVLAGAPSVLAVGLVAALFAAPGRAQLDPRSPLARTTAGTPVPLPDVDVRLAPDGLPADWVNETNAELRTEKDVMARYAEARALRGSDPFLRIDDDPVFGTPRWLASTVHFLTRPVDGPFDAVRIVRKYVEEHPGLFEIRPEVLDEARRTRDYVTPKTRTRHLTFQQTIGGVDLYGAKLRANVTRKGELVNISSTMLPPYGMESGMGFAPSRIALSPVQAIRAAAAAIGTQVTRDPAPMTAPAGASLSRTWVSPDFRADRALTTEIVYFPRTRADIRAAWRVELPEVGIGNVYEVVVDATDGSILKRTSRILFAAEPSASGPTQDVTFRVYTKDSPGPGSPGTSTPNGFQFPTVDRDLVTVTAVDIPQSPNGWINAGDNDTQGNNVDAHTDLNSDNNPDLPRPSGSPFRVFDFPQDNATEPYNWRDASVTNLFFYCNRYHDRLFGLGFDEASGNFQTVNFTGEGLGNDRLLADCQDGLGTNNANFVPELDGVSGRMQMFLWNGPTPKRDGSLDSDIVYHEFTHGVSSRLHELEIYGAQTSGMGEGWSDYAAVSLNADPTDDPEGVYAVGGYTTFEVQPGYVDNYYYGIRRFPYSTDLLRNPMTFADIDPLQQSYPGGVPRNLFVGPTANEAHNVGVLWANILLAIRSKLWLRDGFSANERLLELVVEGMKLDPGTPNFLQARDAILLADLIEHGGEDYPEIWQAFSKRGCGFSAVAPAGDTTSGIVEAFDLPIVITYPDGRPTTLPPNTAATVTVVMSGAGDLAPTLGTETLMLSVNGGPYAATPLVPTIQDHFEATLPASACYDVLSWYITVDTNFGPAASPAAAPNEVFTTQVILGTTALFDDNFETDKGWTTGSSGAVSGAWMRGVPINDPGWAYDPISDADGSGKCFVTGNVPGNSDVDLGSMILTSPVFDMTGGGDISYAYYLNLTDDSGADGLELRINALGGIGHWTTVLRHTTSASAEWRYVTVTAAEIEALGIPFTSTMRIKFLATDASPASVVEAGVDAVHVRKRVCSDPVGTPFCAGDGSLVDCPCSNLGTQGHGCNNSAGTGGARLDAAGTTNPDTVVLLATGELPSVLTLFVQADQVVSAVHFGDGLRCTGGVLKRLYAKSASMGLASAPGVADLPITARSAALGDPINPGESRYYFAYYRDPSASFCAAPAGATFNATNAFAITW